MTPDPIPKIDGQLMLGSTVGIRALDARTHLPVGVIHRNPTRFQNLLNHVFGGNSLVHVQRRQVRHHGAGHVELLVLPQLKHGLGVASDHFHAVRDAVPAKGHSVV